MKTNIALAGNPNCGKTTMFNSLTGTVQYVGNWPGVTVEKKEGKVKGKKDLTVTDLPGIYSLSPYTSEEIVSRDFLKSDESKAVINIVDATNIERNLYLTTQILELGKPIVIALNMMDALKRSGDTINVKKLEEKLGCKVIETVALHNKGTKDLIDEAEKLSKLENVNIPQATFSNEAEDAIAKVKEIIAAYTEAKLLRWTAIKVLEKDEDVISKIKLTDAEKKAAYEITEKLEKSLNDDIESIITNERYNYITDLLSDVIIKSEKKLSVSDKIDRVVTNRWLGIPIFILVMWFIYWLVVSTAGTFMTDWANDTLFGGIQEALEETMTNAEVNPVLIDCIVNGIVGGVGSVLGFVPQMFLLFLLLSIVEDIGYMTRIAFVMDRFFRKFGLSGKSFIPLLVGSGCGVPGIMASRTIENENDRRMTIMTTTWIPCGAKLPVITMIAAILATKLTGTNGSWVAPTMYLVGIGSVLLASIMLKKTKPFHGPAAPFVMELPQYHIPAWKNVLLHTWERTWSFIKKAGTILFTACIVMWFLASYGFVNKSNPEIRNSGSFGLCSSIIEDAIEENPEYKELFADPSEYSLMATVGNGLRYIFLPLGFGNKEGGWQAAASTISGFTAKEGIVATMGVLAGADGDDVDALAEAENVNDVLEAEESEDEGYALRAAEKIGAWFPTALAAFAFLLFNLLDSPCLAAIATMANELKNRKWFWFAILFQNVFAYLITFIFYQIGMMIIHFGDSLYAWTITGACLPAFIVAVILLAGILYMIFRKNPYNKK